MQSPESFSRYLSSIRRLLGLLGLILMHLSSGNRTMMDTWDGNCGRLLFFELQSTIYTSLIIPSHSLLSLH